MGVLCLQPGLGGVFALGEADLEVAVAAAQLVEEIFFACLRQHRHIVGELEEAAHVACLDARLLGARREPLENIVENAHVVEVLGNSGAQRAFKFAGMSGP